MTGPKDMARDGVILCGVFALMIASLFSPLSLLTIWFLPLPFLLFTAKHSWPSAIPWAAVASVLSLFVLHPLGIFAILFAAGTGMVMGALYRSPSGTGTDVVLGGMVTGFAVLLPSLVVAEYGFRLLEGLDRLWRDQWEMAVELFRSAAPHLPLPALPPLAAVLPLCLLILVVPTVLLSAWAGRRILVRSGFPEKGLLPFHEWRFPRSFLYFYILASLAFLFFGGEEGRTFFSVFAGIFTLLDLLFIIQGMAFTAFLLHSGGRSRGWLWIVGVALLIPPVALLLLLLGILDVGTRWRERIREKR